MLCSHSPITNDLLCKCHSATQGLFYHLGRIQSTIRRRSHQSRWRRRCHDLVHFDLLDATLSKDREAHKYWAAQYQEQKEKNRMMVAQDDAAEWARTTASQAENWGHYRKALEALVPHHRHHPDDAFHWPKHLEATTWEDYTELVGGLAKAPNGFEKKVHDGAKDDKATKAEQFWQAKYKEDKEKQMRAAAVAAAAAENVIPANRDTWDHYKHDYIDVLPAPTSIEQELAELREQAAKFKALALVETIGHTLAEEKMHEAEERAKSCEIAEAVLIGAGNDVDVEGGVDA